MPWNLPTAKSSAKQSMAVCKLRIVQTPATTKRFVELDNSKSPITGRLGESKLGRIEKLLSLENLVIAGEAAHISSIRDRDGFSVSGHQET
jgi:hypothetical protein